MHFFIARTNFSAELERLQVSLNTEGSAEICCEN
jgi:hypothetical protein